eukprot:TRINITY_DN73991_c0_g1_i1.p1 TRINITY_DN73991_c0_g1~~TRINITY_DN73991_c0_g1_i1.p1  ORF type:complete len:124 (+),score=17.13 TRINITY_DN73991_c0_g1_i1:73-444(+)
MQHLITPDDLLSTSPKETNFASSISPPPASELPLPLFTAAGPAQGANNRRNIPPAYPESKKIKSKKQPTTPKKNARKPLDNRSNIANQKHNYPSKPASHFRPFPGKNEEVRLEQNLKQLLNLK